MEEKWSEEIWRTSDPFEKLEEGHVKQIKSKFVLVDEILGLKDWTFVKEEQKTKIYSKLVDGQTVPYIRGDADIEVSAFEFVNLLRDVKRRFEWDPLLDDTKVIRRPNSRGNYLYIKFKGKWPVYPRDLVLFATSQIADKEITVIAYSVEDDSTPPISANVRADCPISAWRITEKDKGCHVKYIAQVDLKGYVPTWVANLVGVDGPLNIRRINDVVIKDKSK
eukprot:TRINITY_DN20384_c0_g1_i1.p1 TRINITY_DN20384_c0_g1~~TRINITY_DN20384_c0_g1_i1.p1  ORF type:complete len:222 (+),score=37.95 TRINITY_DN20384_c0_g1_i1:33-698(+)